MFKNFKNTIKHYKAKYIKKDLAAGLSVASISLPQAMAVALIIGVNPVFGIYTHIVATICASFLTISDYIIIGPTNIIAVAIASNLKVISPENYLQSIFLLTLLVGIIQLIFGFMKIGNLVNYISHGVVIGLTTGVALIIASGQLVNILGVNSENSYNVITTIYSVFKQIDQLNPYALFIGIFSLLSIVLIEKSSINIPSYLATIILSILTVKLCGLSSDLEVIGSFSATIPKPSIPSFDLNILKNLLSSVFSISILAFIQIVSILKVLEQKTKESININREFKNLGVINIITSFFKGFVVTGSFSKSFANYEAGAYSRLAGLFSGVSTLLIILLFTPLVKRIPIATLSAIIIIVSFNMIDIKEIAACFKTTKFDSIVFIITFIMTILSPRLDYAVYFGVVISAVIILKRTSDINSSYYTYNKEEDIIVSKNKKEVEKNEYVIINLSGIMQYNVSDNLKKELDRSEIENDKYIIRIRDIEYIDLTTMKELDRFIEKVHNRGGEVYISGVNDEIYKLLSEYGIIKIISEKNIFRAEEKLFSSTKSAIDEIE